MDPETLRNLTLDKFEKEYLTLHNNKNIGNGRTNNKDNTGRTRNKSGSRQKTSGQLQGTESDSDTEGGKQGISGGSESMEGQQTDRRDGDGGLQVEGDGLVSDKNERDTGDAVQLYEVLSSYDLRGQDPFHLSKGVRKRINKENKAISKRVEEQNLSRADLTEEEIRIVGVKE